jgi:hypothetical protein
MTTDIKLGIAITALLLFIASNLTAFVYGDHVGKQSGQVENEKTLLTYSNMALASDEHARAVEAQSDQDLEANDAKYQDEIALLKKSAGLRDVALRAGTAKLQIRLATALSGQGSASATPAAAADSAPQVATVTIPPETAVALTHFCVDDYNALRLQLVHTIEAYDQAGEAEASAGAPSNDSTTKEQ